MNFEGIILGMFRTLLVPLFLAALWPGHSAQAKEASGPGHVQKETKDRKWDITYPVLSNRSMERSVRDWIDKTASDFDIDAPMGDESHGHPSEFKVTSKTYKSPWTETLVLTLYEFTGGAHGMTLTQTFNFDPKTGEEYGFEDVVDLGQKWHQVLLPYIHGKTAAMGVEGNAEQGAGPEAKNFRRFALDGRNLVLYFEPATVAPYVAGTVVVRIPLKDIRKILLPPFNNKF